MASNTQAQYSPGSPNSPRPDFVHLAAGSGSAPPALPPAPGAFTLPPNPMDMLRLWLDNPSLPCNPALFPTPTGSVANAQDLVRLIWARYGTGLPIGIFKVTNLPVPTCLVALAGTEFYRPNQSNGALEDIATALGLNDAYRQAIIESLVSPRTAAICPRGAQLILAGHSLGGMEAQLVAADPRLKAEGFRPTAVITYGSPKVARETALTGASGAVTGFTHYRRFSAIGDPIPESTRGLGVYQPARQIYVDDRPPAQRAAALSVQRQLAPFIDTQIGLVTWIALGITGPHMAYPCINALRTYDALGNPIGHGSGVTLALAPAPLYFAAPPRLVPP